MRIEVVDMTLLPPPPPRTRAECLEGPRPCPHLTCRHHLGPAMSERKETCALDVAARGPVSGRAIARRMGVSHTVVQRVERQALRKLPREVREFLVDSSPTQLENAFDVGVENLRRRRP